MAIPETQLSTWANQGATTTAAATYASVQTALSAATSPVRGRNVEVYLQGSYKNDTNVRGDSDVDVIAQLNDTFYTDTSRLELAQQQRYEAQRTPASYSWSDFRRDVLAALCAYYGSGAVHERNKCITIARNSGRLSADVVVAAEYCTFRRFLSWGDEDHSSGITFWTQRENRQIVNWPKQHYANGVAKNGASQTNGRYKPAVRMFKNARSAAVDRGLLQEADAPSYFVECLIYNVDKSCFHSTLSSTFPTVLNWLREQDMTKFVTGSSMVWLFGQTPEQWSIPEAERTITALISLWNN